jgi:hypothetical protein
METKNFKKGKILKILDERRQESEGNHTSI